MKIFKTAEPETRDSMIALGFSYITEPINDEVWYCFLVDDEEAEEMIASRYGREAFFVGDTLAF